MNTNKKTPRVAVIVVPYSSLKYLPECFESLARLNYPTENLKIMAVDNKSPEPEMEYLRAHWPSVEIVGDGKNLGYAGGNNLAIKDVLARGAAETAEGYDYVWILNPDTVVEPDSLSRLVAACEADEKIGLAQPKILIHDQPDLIQTAGNKIHYLGLGYSGGYKTRADSLTGGPQAVAYASGSAVLIRRAVLEQVGLFTEEFFMYHEDLDLGWRAWLCGWKSVVVPTAVIYHKYSFSRNNHKYFWMERNRWWVLLKNYRWRTLLTLAPALLVFEICICGQAILGGWLGYKIKSYFAIFKDSAWLWRARQDLQKKRVLSDHDFLLLTTGVLEFPDFDNFAVRFIFKFFAVDRKLVLKTIKW